MNFEDFPVEAIQSMEAEAGVIGALLLDNGSWDRLGDKLKPEHFADETHRMVFAEVARQLGAGKSCDVVTVARGDRGAPARSSAAKRTGARPKPAANPFNRTRRRCWAAFARMLAWSR